MSNIFDNPPKWINPCNYSEDYTPDNPLAPLDPNNAELPFVRQAINVLNKANVYKEQFIKDTFNSSTDGSQWEAYYRIYGEQKYDWLPNLPKTLGQEIPKEDLKNLTFDEGLLLNVYEYLQRLAVGMEQVVWDRRHYDPKKGLKDLEQLDAELRRVLSELQEFIVEHGFHIQQDIQRDVMGDELRFLEESKTSRKNRDLIIFKEYINTLEYIKMAFEHLVPQNRK